MRGYLTYEPNKRDVKWVLDLKESTYIRTLSITKSMLQGTDAKVMMTSMPM